MSQVLVHKCPACRVKTESVRIPPRGFIQTFVLLRFGFYPYRCLTCGARYVRLSRSAIGTDLEEVESPIKPTPLVEKQFLSARDHEQFEELIGDIKKAEKWAGLEPTEGEEQGADKDPKE